MSVKIEIVDQNGKTVRCVGCGQHLKVRTATGVTNAEGIPMQDVFGNFYVADEPAEGVHG